MKIATFMGLVALLSFGLVSGIGIGQYQVTLEKDRSHRAWKEESDLRNNVCERALWSITESKWTAYEAKTNELRRLRNEEDKKKR